VKSHSRWIKKSEVFVGLECGGLASFVWLGFTSGECACIRQMSLDRRAMVREGQYDVGGRL
jgi:hypothetical protein